MTRCECVHVWVYPGDCSESHDCSLLLGCQNLVGIGGAFLRVSLLGCFWEWGGGEWERKREGKQESGREGGKEEEGSERERRKEEEGSERGGASGKGGRGRGNTKFSFLVVFSSVCMCFAYVCVCVCVHMHQWRIQKFRKGGSVTGARSAAENFGVASPLSVT